LRILYFDTFSGISGDMILGAFVNAGFPFEELRQELKKIALSGFDLEVGEIKRNSISANKINVVITKEEHVHRNIRDITEIIDASDLSDFVKSNAKKVFNNIALAESRVHNIPLEQVHFHEVGAIDSIVDIIGSVLCIEKFKIDKIYSTPLRVGSGVFVKTRHGNIPLPAPATAELLKNYPSVITDSPYELTTPTGAAIVTTLSNGIMEGNEFKIERIGYGAGDLEIPNLPNLLRIFIGETCSDFVKDDIFVIETTIDDMNPQLYPFIIEKLLEKGANDAHLVPIIMKKGRPGIILSVITPKESYNEILNVIYSQTTTIGARVQNIKREKLPRVIKEFDTSFGKVKAKVIEFQGNNKISPEFEECKRIALEKNLPLLEVQEKIKKELN
jgi:pyridinium-3,5-bisthiocarboxylic acid mononucleotide nickel chelatase